MKVKLTTQYKQMLADLVTPVSIYLKLRDKFAGSILLESSDYHGHENSFSYICFHPIARFEVKQRTIFTQFPKQRIEKQLIQEPSQVLIALDSFAKSFETNPLGFPFLSNGLFGYMAYDAVRYFEDIPIKGFDTPEEPRAIPDIVYQVYKYVIAVNHFKNELYIFEHLPEGESSQLENIESMIFHRNIPSYKFKREGEELSNFSNEGFLEVLEKAKAHCQLGDVFQLVVSRRFEQHFQGDEFNVYRALRSINPSPYLFYFDYGSFKIFGSSPEAQLVIKNGKASIFPIAGTFRRTGNDQADFELAQKLLEDPKENAEHIMLVDLARNDLSRNSSHVEVETFKEIQYYSHVIHLVSKVTAQLHTQISPLQMIASTFPAGTLSGAPKYRAMQLIEKYEQGTRGYYGGCIGFLGFDGEFNQAIMIRSFLSKNNWLFFQAGAGVVAKSETPSELQEVNNKLGALRKALEIAENQ